MSYHRHPPECIHGQIKSQRCHDCEEMARDEIDELANDLRLEREATRTARAANARLRELLEGAQAAIAQAAADSEDEDDEAYLGDVATRIAAALADPEPKGPA